MKYKISFSTGVREGSKDTNEKFLFVMKGRNKHIWKYFILFISIYEKEIKNYIECLKIRYKILKLKANFKLLLTHEAKICCAQGQSILQY